MPLVPSFILFGLFIGAAAVCWRRRQYEHALTRAAIALFYATLTFYPEMEIETARNTARYLWALLAFIEILSFCVISHHQRRKA